MPSTGVIEEWEKAMLAGDIDAIADLYEDDATLVMSGFDIVAEGRGAIRDAWAGLQAMGETVSVTIEQRNEVIEGDYAFAHQHGTLRLRDPSGEESDIPFRTTEVMHRGPDGRWRYTIDHA